MDQQKATVGAIGYNGNTLGACFFDDHALAQITTVAGLPHL